MANISNSTKNTIITGSPDADSIYNSASYVTIEAGAGDDTIYDYNGPRSSINAGTGDDSIYHFNGDSGRINGGDGNDTIINNQASYVSLDGGVGNDIIRADNTHGSRNSTFKGGLGDDSITMSGNPNNWSQSVLEYANGDGNDVVTSFAHTDTLKITDGTINSVTRNGNDVTINIGNGSILLKSVKNVPIPIVPASGNSSLYVNDGSNFLKTFHLDSSSASMSGSDDNEFIYNAARRSTINAGAGNDTIFNFHNSYSPYGYHYASIDAGDGDDSISASNEYYTDYSTINAGSGNDTISGLYNYSKLDFGEGNDYFNGFFAYSTVEAGEGNDTISTRGYYQNSINGGAGNDSIMVTYTYFPNHQTIEGGTGDDTIGLYKKGNDVSKAVIKYADGDGNDIVTGYASSSTIALIDNPNYYTVQSGSDFIINVGEGSITLKDYVASASKPVNIIGGSQVSGESIVASEDSTSLTGGTGNDSIYSNDYRYLTITGGKGNDYLHLKSNRKQGWNTYDGNTVMPMSTNEISFRGNLNANSPLITAINSYTTTGCVVTINEGQNANIVLSDGTTQTLSKGRYTVGHSVPLSTIVQVYDSEGMAHSIPIQLEKAEANTWVASLATLTTAGTAPTETGGVTRAMAPVYSYIKESDGTYTRCSFIDNDGSLITAFRFNFDTSGNPINQLACMLRLEYNFDGFPPDSNEEPRMFIQRPGGLYTYNTGHNDVYDPFNNTWGNTYVTSNTVRPAGYIDTLNNLKKYYSIIPNNYTFQNAVNGATVTQPTVQFFKVTQYAGADSMYATADGLVALPTNSEILNLSTTADFNVINQSSSDGKDTLVGWNESNIIRLTDSTQFKASAANDDVLLTVGDSSIRIKDAKGNLVTVKDKNNKFTHNVYTGRSTIEAIANGSLSGGKDSTLISGTSSADYIYNDMKSSSINAAEGNDTIRDYGYLNVIIAGAGNDSIRVEHLDTINAGAGNDTIELVGNYNVIQYTEGDGNDVILNYNSTDMIQITGSSQYTTTRSGSDFTIKVGTGSITLKNVNDVTPNIVSVKTPSAYNQSGIIVNYNDDVIVNASSVKDTIHNYGAGATISGGGDDDSIHNFEVAEHAQVLGGAGNDSIRNEAYYSTINAGDGNDYIRNQEAYYCLIDGGAGNDTIQNAIGRYSMVLGGAGNDSIRNGAHYATVDAGAGDDTIYASSGKEDSLNGGDGNDLIIVDYYDGSGGRNGTITGGKGNDTIELDVNGFSRRAIIQYNSGDGKDIVTGYNANDSLQIGSNSRYQTLQSGNDIVVSVGSGSITLKDAANIKLNIDGGIFDDINTITNSTNKVLLIGTEGRDSVYNTGNSVTIETGSGNDTIYNNNGYMSWIYAGDGDDSIYSSHAGHYIGGKGNDTISKTNYDDRYYYSNGDGDDVIIGFTPTDTIKLIDTVLDSAEISGNDVKLRIGSGSITLKDRKIRNSIILVKDAYDKLTPMICDGEKIISGIGNCVPKSMINGTDIGDFIYNSLRNGGDSTINAADGDDTIYNYAYDTWVNGGAGNDKITQGHRGTLNGGEGDDTITFTNDYHFGSVLLYKNGDGNDIIQNYSSLDKIQITDGSEYTTTTSGNDVIITVGDGSITLKDAKDKTLNINVKVPESTVLAGLSYNSDKTAVYVSDSFKNKTLESSNYEATVVTVDASSRSKALNINGNANDNFIKGGKGNDTLTGGSGRDYFIYTSGSGNDVITDYTTDEDSIDIQGDAITKATLKKNDVVLTVGKGTLTIKDGKSKTINVSDSTGGMSLTNDGKNVFQVITNNQDNVLINGSAINDSINDTGYENTVVAGKGNDTVSIIDTATVIRYANGDGKDVIITPKYRSRGMIAPYYLVDLTSGKVKSYKVQKKTGDQVLNIGSGSITFKEFNAENHIVVKSDNTYNRYMNGKTFNDLNKGNDYANERSDVAVNGTKSNDFAYLTGNNITLNSGKGDDYIVGNALNTSQINSGEGKDTLNIGYSTSNTIDAGAGNDSISVQYDYHSTIIGGAGNDTITFGTMRDPGTVIEYASGDGKDLIENYSSDITIALTGNAAITKSKVKKDDVILTIGKGSITLKDMKDKPITIMDSNGNVTSAVYGNGVINIEGTEGDDYLIGTATGDSIIGLAGNDTLVGSKGNDTLTGGAGVDTFIYNDGDGNDVITDYTEGELIKITDASIDKITKGKKTAANDIIFKVGKGTITVKDGVGKKITTVDETGVINSQVYGATVMSVFDSDTDLIDTTLNTDLLKVDASERTIEVNLIGNSKANTLISGAGDDTLTGAGGKDVFVHTGGNDLITDYTTKQDSIKFNDSIVSAVENGNDVIFQLGTAGTVTVVGGKDTPITVIDKDDNITTAVWGSTKVTLGNSDGSIYSAISEQENEEGRHHNRQRPGQHHNRRQER